jgi:membrane-associated protease RseP (regulator of RpoE activity)
MAYSGSPWYGGSSYVSGYPYYANAYSEPYYGYGYPSYSVVASSPMTNGEFTYASSYAAPGTVSAPGTGSTAAGAMPAVATSAAGTPVVSMAPGLGVDSKEVVEPDGKRGLRVDKVYPDSAAAKAGLEPGDVIRAANGYKTEVPGNLTWIIDNAAADNNLKMTVVSAKDRREHMITATVRR